MSYLGDSKGQELCQAGQLWNNRIKHFKQWKYPLSLHCGRLKDKNIHHKIHLYLRNATYLKQGTLREMLGWDWVITQLKITFPGHGALFAAVK